ncbi:hypothetical protein LINPERHAP1_LOCUS31278 [Linum perenne]
MFLRKWTPDICPVDLEEKAESLPIWVKFHGVPLQFFSETGLSWIASLIGKPLGSTVSTKRGLQLGHAKVCVELEASADFPEFVSIASKRCPRMEIGVEYCNMPSVCAECGCFGHDCSVKKVKVVSSPESVVIEKSKDPCSEQADVETPPRDDKTPEAHQIDEGIEEGEFTKVSKRNSASSSKRKEGVEEGVSEASNMFVVLQELVEDPNGITPGEEGLKLSNVEIKPPRKSKKGKKNPAQYFSSQGTHQ